MALINKEFFLGKDLQFLPLSCVQNNNLNRQWFIDTYNAYQLYWFPESLKNERYKLVEPFETLILALSTNTEQFYSNMFELLTSKISENYTSFTDITGKYFTLEHSGFMLLDTETNICSSADITTTFYVY